MIEDAREEATSRVFRDKGDTLAGLLKMIRGQGLISGKFGLDPETFQTTYKINPFPARDFLNLLFKFQIDDTTLPEDSDIRDLAAGVLFSLITIGDDVDKKVATLKLNIAQEKEKGTYSEKSFALNEELELLKRQSENLTKLRERLSDTDQLFQDPENETSDPSSDRFFGIVTKINNSLSLYDQALKALEQQDFKKATRLNYQGRARLGATQEAAGNNRPAITQGYEAAYHLYAQALRKQDPERAISLTNQGTARLNATQEAAGNNRPEITQGYEAAYHLYTQALTEQDPQRAIQLTNQGAVRLSATREAAGNNRPEITQGCEVACNLFSQALTEQDPEIAMSLNIQGMARLRAIQEAPQGNNQPSFFQRIRDWFF